ncbi:MAG: hypothetical protein ACREEM_36395 [Blastocatellia bacterium]
MDASAREDYDSPWKEVIERFFEPFMAFYFPRAHRQIAWDKPFEFLDKELQKITRDAEQGRRTVDKLVRVHLKSGDQMWVLIHIEVQSQRDPTFQKRVFVCHYRLFDRHDLPVASLVILSDPHADWRPREFGYSIFGCHMKLRFPAVKLLDFIKREAKLRKSDSPFALLTLAHLKALETRHSPTARYKAKRELVKLLHERDYLRDDVKELLRFIDWELHLPEDIDVEFWDMIDKEYPEMGKKYIASWERIAMKEGRLEALRTNILEAIQLRFGSLPSSLAEIVSSINDPEVLQEMHRQAIQCQSLDGFVERLPAAV